MRKGNMLTMTMRKMSTSTSRKENFGPDKEFFCSCMTMNMSICNLTFVATMLQTYSFIYSVPFGGIQSSPVFIFLLKIHFR